MNSNLSLNMAMTLDGKVVRPDGKWYGLTSKNDRRQMDVYRSKVGAVIVGKNSILSDDHSVKIKYIEEESPTPALLVRNGILSRQLSIFSDFPGKKTIVFCSRNNLSLLQDELGEVARIICSQEETIPARFVIEQLHKLGYYNLLLEGGPTINYSFFSEGLVDTIHLTIVPYLIGQKDLTSIVNGTEALAGFDLQEWQLSNSWNTGNEIFLTYQRATDKPLKRFSKTTEK
ncbi:MAG: RibD family protein [Spirochaetota bacterium]